MPGQEILQDPTARRELSHENKGQHMPTLRYKSLNNTDENRSIIQLTNLRGPSTKFGPAKAISMN